ncbi:hypothetical protein BC833DRAFT_603878 [Globomyces pollinis-pini]|nr:hypothetical protein BC833DRAFT_603878 [Globomyces pollinis-pini]
MLTNQQSTTAQDQLDDFLSHLMPLDVTLTTPVLDFKDHSNQLNTWIDLVYKYKDQLQKLDIKDTELRYQIKDHQQIIDVVQPIMVIMIFEVLIRFNTLTKPFQKSQIQPIYDIRNITESDLDSISTHQLDFTLSNKQKSFYYYLRGKLLNALDAFHQGALDNLTMAVKLDPEAIQAWITLGQVFWKKGDLLASKQCFQWVLNFTNQTDLESLTLLAMVERRLAINVEGIDESLRLCKKCLGLDITYTNAWVGIGNSYMSRYFTFTKDPIDLKKSLSAFQKAQDLGCVNPDLFLSRSIIYRYLDEHTKAIEDFRILASLDGQLKSQCLSSIEQSKSFLSQLNNAIRTKLDFTSTEILNYTTSFSTKSFGFVEATVGDLKVGTTPKTIVKLRIMGSLSRHQEIATSSFICMDTKGDFCGMTVKNVGPEVLHIGDLLVINSPVKLILEDSLVVLRVDDPRSLLVNATPLAADQMTWLEMKVESSF